MIEKSQEDKQICFPCSPLLLPRWMAPFAPAQPPPASSIDRFSSLNQQYTMQGGNPPPQTSKLFPDLEVVLSWQRVCEAWQPAQGRGLGCRWGMRERGEDALSLLCRWAAAPLGPGSRGSIALSREHWADSDMPSPHLQGGTTQLPIWFVMAQEPDKTPESLPIIHESFLMCWKAAHGDKLFWQ